MKKTLSLVFALFTFISISNAQLGLKAGLNLTNIAFEVDGEKLELSDKLAFHVGVTYNKSINDKVSFRPGILFSAKGWKFSDDGDRDDFNASFNYLEVPLDFVYNSGAIDLHAGPYLGYLLSATSDGEDVKEEVQSLDFGINFGLDYNITEKLAIGVNYGLGLVNIVKGESEDDTTAKNKAIGLYIRYKI